MLHIPPHTPQAQFLLTAKSHPATITSKKQIHSVLLSIMTDYKA